MNAQDFWNMFIETGAPEVYLLFNRARRMEETLVCNDPGMGDSGFGVQ